MSQEALFETSLQEAILINERYCILTTQIVEPTEPTVLDLQRMKFPSRFKLHQQRMTRLSNLFVGALRLGIGRILRILLLADLLGYHIK
jgi:hypothetical protein